jgi:hypothetical protein
MKKAGVNGGIQVNLLYPSRWHSNRITKIGHEVDVHSQNVNIQKKENQTILPRLM